MVDTDGAVEVETDSDGVVNREGTAEAEVDNNTPVLDCMDGATIELGIAVSGEGEITDFGVCIKLGTFIGNGEGVVPDATTKSVDLGGGLRLGLLGGEVGAVEGALSEI